MTVLPPISPRGLALSSPRNGYPTAHIGSRIDMSAPPPSAIKVVPNPLQSPRNTNGRLVGFTNGFLGGGGGGVPLEMNFYADDGLSKTRVQDALRNGRNIRESLRRERREHHAALAAAAAREMEKHRKIHRQHRAVMRHYRQREDARFRAAQVTCGGTRSSLSQHRPLLILPPRVDVAPSHFAH